MMVEHDVPFVAEYKRLSGHKSAHAMVALFSDGSKLLRSYNTQVAYIDKYGYLSVSGMYSRTTTNHIRWFLREYAPAVTMETARYLAANGGSESIYSFEQSSRYTIDELGPIMERHGITRVVFYYPGLGRWCYTCPRHYRGPTDTDGSKVSLPPVNVSASYADLVDWLVETGKALPGTVYVDEVVSP